MVLGFFIGFGAAGMGAAVTGVTGVTEYAARAAVAARIWRRESFGMVFPDLMSRTRIP
jgi:hypothetical protein